MRQEFPEALKGRKIPILTLDHKWYRLLDEETKTALAGTEEQLNELLKKQGRLNTETRKVKKVKKQLMTEIVVLADEAEHGGGEELERKLEQRKKLVEECNQRLAEYQDELLELPGEIEGLNSQLMLATMEHCYDIMQENTEKIEEISAWVTGIRIELKKQLIRKQEMERKNYEMYSYLHDVFGAEVTELFDMKYNPEERHPAEQGGESAQQKQE
ncbi:MAG: hypothetical protein NC432_10620 [Roseburia sp.]|nr:hypothetical protein [Roseburia sp.]MCM1099264.1 hypothetical protein [Ruminococcus flavefaciens]